MASGLSLQQVVERLPRERRITRAALHKYETGASAPAPSMVRELAVIYGVPASRLLQTPRLEIAWQSPRAGRAIGARVLDSLRARACAQAEPRLLVERLFPERLSPVLPRVVEARTPAQAEAAAERLRAYWRLGHAPLVSLTRAIEGHGGVVVALADAPTGFECMVGTADGGEPVFVVRGDGGAELQRMALACALARCVMRVPAFAARTIETRFAMALLVPADAARADLGARRRRVSFEELVLLHDRYGLSVPLCTRRAVDLGILPSRAVLMRSTVAYPMRPPADASLVRDAERPHERMRTLLLRAVAEGVIGPVEAEAYLQGDITTSGSHQSASRATSMRSRTPSAKRQRVLERDAQRLTHEHAPGGRLEILEAFEERDAQEGED